MQLETFGCITGLLVGLFISLVWGAAVTYLLRTAPTDNWTGRIMLLVCTVLPSFVVYAVVLLIVKFALYKIPGSKLAVFVLITMSVITILEYITSWLISGSAVVRRSEP